MSPQPETGHVRRPAALFATALAVFALAATCLAASPARAATVGEDGKPITNSKGVTFAVLSHRGGALERPENSLEAFEYSVAEGFDIVETDLLFTKDGHGVLNHDDRLKSRCTSAGKQIHLMTLAEVRTVRCEDFRTKAKTVPIPTFSEFAAVVKPSKIRIDLDIKTWSGQPASGERLYADRAIRLLKKHGLLERTSISTFRWSTTLPTIRKLAPKIRVVGLDNKPMDLGRVKLAAKLGADGFGIKAVDMPVNLMRYINANGMDAEPWEVRGNQLLAYSIYFGGKQHNLSSDAPARTRDALLGGEIDLEPTPVTKVTKLSSQVTVAKKASYKAKVRKYPKVMGTAVPWDKLTMLDSVKVKIRVSKGSGKGYISLGAADSPISSSVKVKIPKGSRSIWVKVPVGNGGKLRVFASRKTTFKLSVVEYTNLSFR